MTTETQTQNQNETSHRSSEADTALGFAVLGLLATGAIGLVKALDMKSGLDVLLCLLGSVVAFGAVFYIYLRKQ